MYDMILELTTIYEKTHFEGKKPTRLIVSIPVAEALNEVAGGEVKEIFDLKVKIREHHNISIQVA